MSGVQVPLSLKNNMVLNLFFFFFSSVLLISSLMIISVQNAIYSVIFLVLSFVSSAGILFLMECELFALLFIVVYVGAIAVLFLFVVMMLDVKTITVNRDSLKYFPFGIFVGAVLFVQIASFLSMQYEPLYFDSITYNSYQDWYDKIDSVNEMQALGQVLYTHYVLQFLIAGLILTLSVIGAIVLTINSFEKKSQSQIITKQLSRKQQNSLYI